MSGTFPAHRRSLSVETTTTLVLFSVTALVLVLRNRNFLQGQKLQQWSTVFSAVVLQAMPFLVLGVAISGLVAAFVPAQAMARLLPRRALFNVPIAAMSGAALPGCECSSVPVTARLIAKGAPAPAAFAFLLAAPAINPVVVVATVVAFPGHPSMAVARVLASLLAAITVGWCWTRIRQPIKAATGPSANTEFTGWRSRADISLTTAGGDFLLAGGYLVVGAALAASLQVLVPRNMLAALPGQGFIAVLAMAVLAIVLAVCSEADAFIAASLTHFSYTARLAFLVVGPMLDFKLIALQSGTFGRAFVWRFAPLVLAAAVGSASLIGWVVL